MKKEYRLIPLIVFITVSVNGMVFSGGSLSRLDILLQKFTRCNHHQKNYEQNFVEGIVPTGLKLKKGSAFHPVSADFDLNWNNVLYDAEKKLVRLLLEESKKVITKIDTGVAIEIETKYPEPTREEREKIKRKYKNIEWILEVKRKKKWEKFRFRESNQKRQIKHITQRHYCLN